MADNGAGPGAHRTNTAANREATGDAFVIRNLPRGTLVGCDTIVLTVKAAAAGSADRGLFSGFCGLPPGAHFVWMSPPGAMARQGCWFVTSHTASVIRVTQWDRLNEALGPCPGPGAAAAVPAVDPSAPVAQLLPYDRGTTSGGSAALAPPWLPAAVLARAPDAGSWPSVTSCITESVLGRVAGAPAAGGGAPSPAAWFVSTSDSAKGEAAIPGTHEPAGSRELCFLFSRDDLDPYRLAAAQEHTAQGHTAPPSVDTTDRIVASLDRAAEPLSDGDAIGELQFAFLSGTLLCNLACLDQWWHLVLKIFLRAQRLPSRRPTLCLAFLQTLHAQLAYLDRHVAAGGFVGRASNPAAGDGARAGEGDDGGGAGIFDTKPHGAARLRASLAAFRHHLDEALPEIRRTTPSEAAALTKALADVEAFLGKHRGSAGDGGRGNAGADDGDDDDDDDDEAIEAYDAAPEPPGQAQRHHHSLSDSDSDADQPVVVELDENGREVGLVSWH